MVNWQSPAEIVKDALAFDKFVHALLGVYLWEWAISLDFDWQIVTGKKRFQWPLVFYFLNRYCLLFALIGVAIALSVTTEIDCQALYRVNSTFGNASIGLASINLSLRTMAVWSRKRYIVIPLVVIILGHWSLLLHGILLRATWIPGKGCTILDTDNTVLAASFIYSMAFDFIVMSLMAIRLLSSTVNTHARLVHLVFHDGLVYFIVSFLSNLIATIFMILNLNAVMSIIANVPAAVISTIAACRVVRRLANFNGDDPDFLSSQLSTLAFRPGILPTISRSSSATWKESDQMETTQSPSTDRTISTISESDAV